MNGNFRVGNLFGIPFFINVSWFIVLALVTLNFGSGLLAQFPGLGVQAWGLGFVLGLLLFASVLLHELGHSFAAIQRGIRVNSITLFLFGGLASLDDEAKTPTGAFWIAVAGPLVSLALFGLLFILASSSLITGPLAMITGLLAYINLVIATFNMIPGLPLDGGNVLKAAVWKITGNRYRGTRWASRTGQLIGWGAIAIGALSVLGLSNIGSFWTLIIGWFLLQNAGRSAQSATLQEALSGLTAADAVLEDSPVITANSTLRDLADASVLSGGTNRWQRFLVKDDQGQFVGTIQMEVLQNIPSDQWSDREVRDFVTPMSQTTQVRANEPLLEVMGQLDQQGIQALAVIQENGVLVGLLEKAQIVALLQQKMQAQPA